MGDDANEPMPEANPLEHCIEIRPGAGDTFLVNVHNGPHVDRYGMGRQFGFTTIHDLMRWLSACVELHTKPRPVICTREMLERAGKPTGPIELAEPGTITIVPPGSLGGFGNHA